MTEHLNVAQRLAEGAPAVEHTQSYVRACHVLGYQHPDLTAYASQIRDWYDTEDGLNLWLLDNDCMKLREAANAADEALSRQRAQHAQLAEAWLGPGAGAATEFLQRHCGAGEAVAASVRAAAERCAALRDDLWQLIDAKAATAIAVDDRRLAERPVWLAAAQTVLTGAGDRSPADDLVDQQIKPYVDNDIRTEWLDAMRSTAASVDALLDAATEAVNAAVTPRFEVPGDLAAQSAPLDEPSAPNIPVPVQPAGAGATPADSVPAGVQPKVVAAPPVIAGDVPAPAPAPTDDPLGTALGGLAGGGGTSGLGGLAGGGGMSGLGGLGSTIGGTSGLGGLGSAIGGVISQIVDAVGGLLGSLGDGPDEPFLNGDDLNADDLNADDRDDQLDTAAERVPEIPEHPGDAHDNGEPVAPETPEDPPAATPQVEDPAPAPAGAAPSPTAEPAPPTAEPPSTAEPSPPPTEPPPADPALDKRTPCEVAADELPQAGQ